MALTALVLYLLGLLLAFGARTLAAWRRTGDTGFRRSDTTAFTASWWGSVLFVGALLLGLAAPVAGLLDLFTVAVPTGVGAVGLVLAVPSVLSAVALLVFAAAVQVQVRAIEEPYLVRTHGSAYLRYAARTGRFLPGIGRLAVDDTTTEEPR
ncbi:isoprenylcysteine carboxylmethyltransferase family protein [Nocardiopsis aegyptia]|uniref:isoprenylcysteine carboxylmethyltransferase family protein n=1 Tax=Nocardiopsis aegyptia TaxID=220378 RepID=UPI003673383C